MSLRLFVIVGLAGLFLIGSLAGAEPPREQVLPKLPKGPLPPVAPTHVNRYEVWQNYDVDRFGRFRPLVINTPCGAYYRCNGQWYPWVETHPLEFLRHRVD
jgi:hypothetical protein